MFCWPLSADASEGKQRRPVELLDHHALLDLRQLLGAVCQTQRSGERHLHFPQALEALDGLLNVGRDANLHDFTTFSGTDYRVSTPWLCHNGCGLLRLRSSTQFHREPPASLLRDLRPVIRTDCYRIRNN